MADELTRASSGIVSVYFGYCCNVDIRKFMSYTRIATFDPAVAA